MSEIAFSKDALVMNLMTTDEIGKRTNGELAPARTTAHQQHVVVESFEQRDRRYPDDAELTTEIGQLPLTESSHDARYGASSSEGSGLVNIGAQV